MRTGMLVQAAFGIGAAAQFHFDVGARAVEPGAEFGLFGAVVEFAGLDLFESFKFVFIFY